MRCGSATSTFAHIADIERDEPAITRHITVEHRSPPAGRVIGLSTLWNLRRA
jgi:hypothetical protein